MEKNRIRNLADCMSKIGYRRKQTAETLLPNGKKFVRLDFEGERS